MFLNFVSNSSKSTESKGVGGWGVVGSSIHSWSVRSTADYLGLQLPFEAGVEGGQGAVLWTESLTCGICCYL